VRAERGGPQQDARGARDRPAGLDDSQAAAPAAMPTQDTGRRVKTAVTPDTPAGMEVVVVILAPGWIGRLSRP
jgi:hypothetical protein